MEIAMLRIEERIHNAISLGESHFREFKSASQRGTNIPRETRAICKDIGETLVGFANADGGELLIGVEDDGQVTGIPHSPSDVEKMLAAPETHIHANTLIPPPLTGKMEHGGKLLLYFATEKGTRLIHLTSDGRCLQRKDRETVPVASEQIVFERQEQISREYDRAFDDAADVSDLDSDLLVRVANEISRGMSPEKCLQYLGLAEYTPGRIRFRRAALLLFARDIRRWHPRCEVRIMRISGIEVRPGREYNVISDETASDNIVGLLSKAWDILRPHLVETKLSADAIFREHIMYPEDACREALINAIAHRDYSIEGRGIEVSVFDDRMDIRSPGGLLSTITIPELRKLKGLHQSRNALVSRVLRELGYMREMGEGFRRIYYLLRVNDLVPADLRADQEHFSITLHHRTVFSETDQRWLDSFEAFSLSREERLVVLLGRTGELISPQQIYDTLDLVDWDIFRSIVHGLQLKGILASEIAPSQAYLKARKKGVARRRLKRFAIRPPQECEAYLNEVLQVLSDLPAEDTISRGTLESVVQRLTERSPYRVQAPLLTASLRALNLIDDDKRPSGRLLAIWKISAVRVPSATKEEAPTTTVPDEHLLFPDLEDLHLEEKAPRQIYLGGFDYQTSEAAIRELFGRFGEVQTIDLAKDYYTGHSRGFAFILMPNTRQAMGAVAALNGFIWRGRAIRVGWAHRSKQELARRSPSPVNRSA